MKKTLLIVSVCFLWSQAKSQSDYVVSIQHFQEELNAEFKDSISSPLPKPEISKFLKHQFFPIDSTYRVMAIFEKMKTTETFSMTTTTDRKPIYDKYGICTFVLGSDTLQLSIYQSHTLRLMEEYKNHLFLPFTDLTNGNETYGGGRYIDLEIPEGDTLIIDFNKAYNPYCAYGSYSCPIPPEENFLDRKIEAGILFRGH